MDASAAVTVSLKILEPAQKAAVEAFLKKLAAREKILKDDIGLFGYSFRTMPHNLTAEFFRVTRQSLYNWEKDKCPRNTDGSFDLFALHQWLVSRETAKFKKVESLKDKKTEKEIEKLEIGNLKAKEEMIPRSEYLDHVRSWASSFRSFWGQAVRRNVHLFVNRQQDELDVMFEEFGRKLMEIWGGGGK